jgi:hypothetical protein
MKCVWFDGEKSPIVDARFGEIKKVVGSTKIKSSMAYGWVDKIGKMFHVSNIIC